MCFFSFQGNYLIRSGPSARPRLRAAMLLSSCFDTFHGMQSLERPGLNRMLNAHLASCLVESVKRVKHHFEPSKLDSFSADLDRVFSSRTIREFDSSFTAPQFGYPSEREYYEDAKLAGRLGEIAVPTLAMNAEDDPCQVRTEGNDTCTVYCRCLGFYCLLLFFFASAVVAISAAVILSMRL